MPVRLSRRAALCSVLSLPLVVAACTSDDEAPPIDPDRVALEAALGVETALLGSVESLPEPVVLSVVQAHVDALRRALGTTATGSPGAAPSADTTVPSAARAADRAADQHTRALRTASAGVSPLLASIAASDAAVAASLRASAR